MKRSPCNFFCFYHGWLSFCLCLSSETVSKSPQHLYPCSELLCLPTHPPFPTKCFWLAGYKRRRLVQASVKMLKEHIEAVGDISIPKGLGIYLEFEFSPNFYSQGKERKKRTRMLSWVQTFRVATMHVTLFLWSMPIQGYSSFSVKDFLRQNINKILESRNYVMTGI